MQIAMGKVMPAILQSPNHPQMSLMFVPTGL